MESTWLEEARAIRDRAYDALLASPEYAAFKTFDDAVVQLGGASKQPSEYVRLGDLAKRVVEAASNRMSDGRKLSQGDAAEIALAQGSEPLPIGRLMEAAIAKGAEISGANALNNFRSMVSKDARFRSIKRNGIYFWWLVDQPLSPNWSETADPDLLDESAASSTSSGAEGGDGHGPATT